MVCAFTVRNLKTAIMVVATMVTMTTMTDKNCADDGRRWLQPHRVKRSLRPYSDMCGAGIVVAKCSYNVKAFRSVRVHRVTVANK